MEEAYILAVETLAYYAMLSKILWILNNWFWIRRNCYALCLLELCIEFIIPNNLHVSVIYSLYFTKMATYLYRVPEKCNIKGMV